MTFRQPAELRASNTASGAYARLMAAIHSLI